MRIKMFFKRTALSVIIVGMCAYISALTYLYMQQRNFLFAPSPVEISPSTAGFPQAEVMRLKTHDGESIVTWWVAPQNDKPVTIFFHGNSDRLDKRVERFKIMTSEGDGLLAVSYRGYGGSSGKPSEAGFFEDARTAYE
jgi:cephalosporin-C deacetylase-like acetyl esterase